MILLSVLMLQFGTALWILVASKFLFEAAVLILGARKFGYWSLLKWFPIWFLAQPLYISYVGLMGLRGKFTWKP